MNDSINLSGQAVRQSEIERYMRLQSDLYDTINFLKNLAGSELYFNDFKEAIIRLEGWYRGMKLADHHNELIQYEISRNTARREKNE